MNVVWLFFQWRGVDQQKRPQKQAPQRIWLLTSDVTLTHSVYKTHVSFELSLTFKDKNDCTLISTGNIDDFYYIGRL